MKNDLEKAEAKVINFHLRDAKMGELFREMLAKCRQIEGVRWNQQRQYKEIIHTERAERATAEDNLTKMTTDNDV